MEKLKLEHLVPYLLYGLKCNAYSSEWDIEEVNQQMFRLETGGTVKNPNNIEVFAIIGDSECTLDIIKPILRPLSDLTEELVNELLPSMHISKEDIKEMNSTPIGHWKYYQVISAAQMHIDFRGLIDKGLAIDINSIGKKDNYGKDENSINSILH